MLNMSKPPQSTSLNCQADRIKSQQSPDLCIFLVVQGIHHIKWHIGCNLVNNTPKVYPEDYLEQVSSSCSDSADLHVMQARVKNF